MGNVCCGGQIDSRTVLGIRTQALQFALELDSMIAASQPTNSLPVEEAKKETANRTNRIVRNAKAFERFLTRDLNEASETPAPKSSV